MDTNLLDDSRTLAACKRMIIYMIPELGGAVRTNDMFS
jgi:hypothetical protein